MCVFIWVFPGYYEVRAILGTNKEMYVISSRKQGKYYTVLGISLISQDLLGILCMYP